MKSEALVALVAYRLQRAPETLDEARLMQDAQHWNTCANRLYNRLFDLRQEGDYVDFVSLDAEAFEPLVEATKVFVDRIRALLES